MPPKKQTYGQCKYEIHKYTVIRVDHEDDDDEKLFECVPDRWFVDERKTFCYWPPATGKSFSLRAISCEKPDDSWNIYPCTVISAGHCKWSYYSIFYR